MIEYKAVLKGILVATASEAYTSRTCHVCGCEGDRKLRDCSFALIAESIMPT
jgi:transposase